jgi:hypothetical protein
MSDELWDEIREVCAMLFCVGVAAIIGICLLGAMV